MSHPHDHRTGSATRLTLAVLVPAAVITLIGMVLLWPPRTSGPTEPEAARNVGGKVTAVHEVECPTAEPGTPEGLMPTACGTVSVLLLDGPEAGTSIETEIPSGPGAPVVRAGDKLTLMYLPDGGSYQITDHQRSTELWLIAGAFVLAVVAFGRLRGVSALAGLAVTFAILLLFIVPAILAGGPPLPVAIVGAAAITLVVLYLTHGFRLSTSVAVVGTLASLTLTGLLSAIAVALTHLTGVSDEQTMTMTIYYGNINMQGLLLAGILIGSLGVLDDVTVTQAATVAELARADPRLGMFGLYRAASRVGRAHIAAVVNTLILAYAGTSMPLLLSFAASNMRLGTILTEQLMAQELVRGAVGTIGLIAAVPITTFLAALASRRFAPETAQMPLTPEPPERTDSYAEALLDPKQANSPWA